MRASPIKKMTVAPIGRNPDLVSKDLGSMVQDYFDTFIESHPNFYEINDLHSVVCQEVEKALIQKVMDKTNNNQSKAAKILGLNRNTLRNKLILYKIG